MNLSLAISLMTLEPTPLSLKMSMAIYDPSPPLSFTPYLRSKMASTGPNGNHPTRISARNMAGIKTPPPAPSRSASKDGGSPAEADVRFPRDYSELLEQAKAATELAFKDKNQLIEIEFPTAGLDSVPGDGEGGIEMTGSVQLIREFCDLLIPPEKVTRTRVFFPEANEADFARQSAFAGSSLKLDYLTRPSFFEDFGFVTRIKMADRVKAEDEIFLVAYPYFNVNEMLVVEELYKEAVVDTPRKLVVFNGELDRIRSGYYPPFFYPKLAALAKTFIPKLETAYYVHNFKGRNGGKLFRCYPGPWRVLRSVRGEYVCLHRQQEMPSLKEVALDILPSS